MPAFEGSRDYTAAPQDPQTVLVAANRVVPQALNAVLKSVPPTLQDNSPVSQSISFPAPVLGIKDVLVSTSPSALEMENFWPTTRGLEVRKGYVIVHDFGRDDNPLALISHDITNELLVLYPGIMYAWNRNTGVLRVLSHSFSSKEGVVSSISVRVELGVATIMVNGVDPMIIYNGSDTVEIDRLKISQDLEPTLTFLDTSTIESVWLYGKRVFFADKGSNSAWYLDISAVPINDDGIEQVTELPLGNVFPGGGILTGGFSWSVDVGDNLNNRCVFTSDKGEFAVYSGDPDLDFVLDGLYVSGNLLNKNSLFFVGGDAYMLLDTGFKLLSEIVRGAPQGGEIGSLEEGSYNSLRKALNLGIAQFRTYIVVYNRLLDMALLINTDRVFVDHVVVAYNTKLKAWTTFTGWRIQAAAVSSNNQLMFLDNTGKLCVGWIGSGDGVRYGVADPDGLTRYTAFVRYTFSPVRELMFKKTATGLQGVWDNMTKVCPSYQMVGYRGKDRIPDPDPCPPDVGLPMWSPVIPDPDDDIGGHTNSSLDVRAFSTISPLTYKIGGDDGAGAHGPNADGAFAFVHVEIDGEGHDIEGKRMPLFVAFDFNHADGVVPVWVTYVMTDADMTALEAAGSVISNDLRPPADSVRGWRSLNVQMWDTDDGRPEGYTFPAHSVIASTDNISIGELLPQQTVSPYVGHAVGQQIVSNLKGMWLSHGGEFWVHDNIQRHYSTNPPTDRAFVLFRPMAEVEEVTSQLAQDFGNLAAGKRGLIYFYLDVGSDYSRTEDPLFSTVASSSRVGRWFSVTLNVESTSLFFEERTWVIGGQVSAPANIAPDDIPGDYQNG